MKVFAIEDNSCVKERVLGCEWSSYSSVGRRWWGYLGAHSKVAQLDRPLSVDQNIGWLDICGETGASGQKETNTQGQQNDREGEETGRYNMFKHVVVLQLKSSQYLKMNGHQT